ncbi:4Fe-4S dicluster domain-containing protein [Enhydrobacter aerosaccus]|uniref:4Fe-4S dicluster domain-containing protein n=1 Tax=Enhydrobacter aerosaccus TaxID=225324 RepID=A0A1T4SAU0_9HYPH|nr:4Fe-4S dicluster domain-containing protein [Enhydrobacter aerosaccus]SKA25359.1 4Fe-4S dicluster domain-containing protein [Enhydrobacter aerosaccus]
MERTDKVTLTVDALQGLLDELRGRGFRVVGPTLRDKAIVYDDIAQLSELPRGWTDEQAGGHYRLVRREDDALFGYAVGPQSWKRFLHQPVQRLWQAVRDGEGARILPELPSNECFAFIGVRACELHAIAIQDRVLLGGRYVDPHYRARRDGAFIVALNCSAAGGICFCVSMKTGPTVEAGFDIALTEIVVDGQRRFIAEAASAPGRDVLAQLPQRPATTEEIEESRAVLARTAATMGRTMRSDDLRDLLMRNLDHPRWDDVAARCLTCGNCTMACPTCFCTSVEESSDLAGETTSHSRRWDSCFTMDFSYIHGGSVRASARSRYRQWMTHKLASWIDQFGSSGCVGCGRCVTWCPVGIDITEEVSAIRESESAKGGQHEG